MAKQYKAVSVAGVSSADGTLVYTVPSQRTAKLTFISAADSSVRIGIKLSGEATIIRGPSLTELSYAVGITDTISADARKCINCIGLGIYFSAGDEIYLLNYSAYNAFLSLMEEYESN